MSFFDQKEDVLQVEMTPYGKYLYSIGKFSPAYYSFHDNDIIYDISYADDRTEYPSESFPRIVQDCLYLKPQARFKSVEKTKKAIVQNLFLLRFLFSKSIFSISSTSILFSINGNK